MIFFAGHFSCSTVHIMEHHLQQHLEGRLSCYYCQKEFMDVHLVSMHTKEEHVNKSVMCEHCPQAFLNSTQLNLHMAKIHRIPVFKCKFCDEKFLSKVDSNEHMFDTHEGTMIKCPVCNKLVPSTEIEKHSKSITCVMKSNTYVGGICPICGKILRSTYKLKLHISTVHDNVRKYKCHLCSHSAKCAKTLQMHLTKHTGLY